MRSHIQSTRSSASNLPSSSSLKSASILSAFLRQRPTVATSLTATTLKTALEKQSVTKLLAFAISNAPIQPTTTQFHESSAWQTETIILTLVRRLDVTLVMIPLAVTSTPLETLSRSAETTLVSTLV